MNADTSSASLANTNAVGRVGMSPRVTELDGGRTLVIREALPEDAGALLRYLEAVSGESDFLTFGPGEFELTQAQEEVHLRRVREALDQLYIIGTIDAAIVALLSFTPGHRARVRHSGEFAISVGQSYWGRGVGGLMLDALLEWARAVGTVRKIALRVRTDNLRGIALYRRKGFVTEGTLRGEICVRGEYFDLLYMGLQL